MTGSAAIDGDNQLGALVDQFIDGIEQIVRQTDANDLRGHFKLVNGMRNQTGELTPQTLYYYPRPSNNGRSS